jgi:hypothetical protein
VKRRHEGADGRQIATYWTPMMGSDNGLDFLRYPPVPHAKLAQGKADQGLPREAETMVVAVTEAASVQSAVSFSPTSNPNQNFSHICCCQLI